MPDPENRPADTATLIALPGRLFFTESVACPASLDAAQADSLMRLTVESRSPFAEEKLAVCRRHDREAGRLLAFAALKERLAPHLPKTPVRHAVPDAALPLPPAVDGHLWIATDNALTFLRMEHGAPVVVRGFSASDAPEDSAWLAARDQHAAKAGLPAGGPLWKISGAAASRKTAGVNLIWRELCKDSTHTEFMSEVDLDAADVRPATTVAALRDAARAGHRVTLAFRSLGVLAALLFFAQCGVWSLNFVASRREDTLAQNRPVAEAAEAKAGLLDTLGKVTDRRTPQLEWLAVMNESRPDSVWIRKVAVDERGLTAWGQARSMEVFNTWLASLRRAKEFSEVQAPRITTAGSSVAFELRAIPSGTRIHKKDTDK